MALLTFSAISQSRASKIYGQIVHRCSLQAVKKSTTCAELCPAAYILGILMNCESDSVALDDKYHMLLIEGSCVSRQSWLWGILDAKKLSLHRSSSQCVFLSKSMFENPIRLSQDRSFWDNIRCSHYGVSSLLQILHLLVRRHQGTCE